MSEIDTPSNLLSAVEIRVLGALAEKEATTPDNYPMSLNGLVSACNQLTSRDPVMNLSEAEISEALDQLVQKKLASVIHQAGARVAKYEHKMRVKWMLEQNKLAVLTVLMLRGWQTAGEIRTRVGRLHEFASVAEVEQCLDFLIDKYPPVVARLPIAPGTKEPRYAHLLSGDESSLNLESLNNVSHAASSHNKDRIAQLEEEVQSLRAQVQDLQTQFAEFKKQFE
ncbi:YceH family protein [Undibacterium sp. LX40W]|uniref:YceH family protein n=1 Tax=Undibacterium nitidum TaxID=2762298 RepID=A0A923HNP0_9BURK|nr:MULTISPECIES: DUF480 domain-containing protein [Undibacterium]MBC3882910.1 YceH family protein [Undibacterium nitidum]MBC3893191.1 YceH family protein [Undibacterium sp. LX40W]